MALFCRFHREIRKYIIIPYFLQYTQQNLIFNAQILFIQILYLLDFNMCCNTGIFLESISRRRDWIVSRLFHVIKVLKYINCGLSDVFQEVVKWCLMQVTSLLFGITENKDCIATVYEMLTIMHFHKQIRWT